jgi:hypothetical protein
MRNMLGEPQGRLSRVRLSDSFARPAAWLLLVASLLGALGLFGCDVRTYSAHPPQDDPGRGHTFADRMYNELKPQVGELVGQTNPGSARRELGVEVDRLGAKHPDWDVTSILDADWPRQEKWGFADGSILIMIVKPNPGPHEDPPGEDTGGSLVGVQVVRP